MIDIMPVNGLLLTLAEDQQLIDDVLVAVAELECIELGERTGRWQPVVVETKGTKDSHDIHEWLESLSGVVMVDVVFSSVDDQQGESKVAKGEPSTQKG